MHLILIIAHAQLQIGLRWQIGFSLRVHLKDSLPCYAYTQNQASPALLLVSPGHVGRTLEQKVLILSATRSRYKCTVLLEEEWTCSQKEVWGLSKFWVDERRQRFYSWTPILELFPCLCPAPNTQSLTHDNDDVDDTSKLSIFLRWDSSSSSHESECSVCSWILGEHPSINMPHFST